MRVPASLFLGEPARLRDFVTRAESLGVDRLTVGDHVSFQGGQGFDGLLQAGMLAALSTSVEVMTAVYLLVLRHPVPTTRQIATIANLAEGRFGLGVGLGGEDPHEFELCGIDHRTRGRRLDESIDIVRSLLSGEAVDHHGEFFDLEDARILPAPDTDVPVLVGGRSEAALRRVATRGDGWIALFVSPRRFREGLDTIDTHAAAAGREVAWRHAMHLWCGFDTSPDRLADAMESLYRIPYERFERYAPWGAPADVAAWLAPYVEAGATHLNLSAVAASPEAALEATAEVKRLLAVSHTS